MWVILILVAIPITIIICHHLANIYFLHHYQCPINKYFDFIKKKISLDTVLPTVETSIKVSDAGKVAVKRFTLPIANGDHDIIYGGDYNKGIDKIYYDYPPKAGSNTPHEIICFESSDLGGNKKRYVHCQADEIVDIYIKNIYQKLDDVWGIRHIMSKQDDKVSNNIVGYHFNLSKPVCLRDIIDHLDLKIEHLSVIEQYMNDNVYWVSVVDSGEITFYLRPKLPEYIRSVAKYPVIGYDLLKSLMSL